MAMEGMAGQLRRRLAAGDVAWMRQRFAAGDLNFLRDRLRPEHRAQFARRLEAGDQRWLGQVLSHVDVPGVGRLGEPPPEETPDARGATLTVATAAATSVTNRQAPGTPAPPTPATSATPATPATTPKVVKGAVPPAPKIRQKTAPAAREAAVTPPPPAPRPPRRAAQTVDPKKAKPATNPAVLAEAVAARRAAAQPPPRRDTDQPARRRLVMVLAPLLVVAAVLAFLLMKFGRDDKVATSAATAAKGATTAPPSGTNPSAASSSSPATGAVAGTSDLIDTISKAGTFVTLLHAVDQAGLAETLRVGGPYTMFAPTDAAFRSLPADTLSKVLANKGALTRLLSYHLLAGKVTAANATGKVKTLEGSVAIVTSTAGKLTVNGFPVTGQLAATNGLVNTIDNVLIPPDIDLSNLSVATTAVTVPTTPAPSTPTTETATTATTAATSATASTASATSTPAKPFHAGAGADFFVYFADQDAVLDDAAKAVIAAAAERIKALPVNPKVVLTGYVDGNTPAAQKSALSKQRAEAVQAALVAAGANANYQLVAHGDVWEPNLAQARRVEINLP